MLDYNPYNILVIILSITLAIFLILAIVTVVKLNQILSQVQRITDKAEKFANTAESVGQVISATTGASLIGKLVNALGDQKNRKGKE